MLNRLPVDSNGSRRNPSSPSRTAPVPIPVAGHSSLVSSSAHAHPTASSADSGGRRLYPQPSTSTSPSITSKPPLPPGFSSTAHATSSSFSYSLQGLSPSSTSTEGSLSVGPFTPQSPAILSISLVNCSILSPKSSDGPVIVKRADPPLSGAPPDLLSEHPPTPPASPAIPIAHLDPPPALFEIPPRSSSMSRPASKTSSVVIKCRLGKTKKTLDTSIQYEVDTHSILLDTLKIKVYTVADPSSSVLQPYGVIRARLKHLISNRDGVSGPVLRTLPIYYEPTRGYLFSSTVSPAAWADAGDKSQGNGRSSMSKSKINRNQPPIEAESPVAEPAALADAGLPENQIIGSLTIALSLTPSIPKIDDVTDALANTQLDEKNLLHVLKDMEVLAHGIFKTGWISTSKFAAVFPLVSEYFEKLLFEDDNKELLSLKPLTDPKPVRIIYYFMRFIIAGYGPLLVNYFGKGKGFLRDSLQWNAWKKMALHVLNIPEADLLIWDYKEDAHFFKPKFFLALDRSSHSLVFSVRGTADFKDALVDMCSRYEAFEDGYVHSGWLSSARWVVEKYADEFVSLAQKHNVSSFYCVGHSMGGAIAVLVGILLRQRLPELQRHDAGFRIHCFTIGCPAVLSWCLAEKYAFMVDTFINQNDGVPYISVGAVMDFRDLLGMAETLAQDKRMSGAEKLRALKTAHAELRTNNTHAKLYPAGNIFLMTKVVKEDVGKYFLSTLPSTTEDVSGGMGTISGSSDFSSWADRHFPLDPSLTYAPSSASYPPSTASGSSSAASSTSSTPTYTQHHPSSRHSGDSHEGRAGRKRSTILVHSIPRTRFDIFHFRTKVFQHHFPSKYEKSMLTAFAFLNGRVI